MANNRNDNRGNPDQERDSMGRFTEDDDNTRSSGSRSGMSNEQSGRGSNQNQPRDEEGRFTDQDGRDGGSRSGGSDRSGSDRGSSGGNR